MGLSSVLTGEHLVDPRVPDAETWERGYSQLCSSALELLPDALLKEVSCFTHPQPQQLVALKGKADPELGFRRVC